MNTTILRYGRLEPLPKVHSLQAGPLSLVYEAGDLRYIKLADKEIIRRLYVAVRDQNWGTVTGIIHNEQVKQSEHSFEITYESLHQQGEIEFVWNALIRGEANGHISFEMKGEAKSAFLRNRIGFCVLHPLRECMGVEATIQHVDGSSHQTPFPTHVAPQLVVDGIIQPVHPFSEMRSLRYNITPEIQAEIEFSGDIFEMEDQRNWIDASYKTYCTPLRLPWPIEIKKGEKVEQSVRLILHGTLPKVTTVSTEATTITIGDNKAALPPVGLSMSSHGEALNERELEHLRRLKLSHLRVDLMLAENYQAKLEQAIRQAKELNVRLELALILSDNAEAELNSLVKYLENIPVLNVLIFHVSELSTSEGWLKLTREIFKANNLAITIYGGSNAYFTHINAEKPPVDALDGVVYSINPQVHAFDNSSIAETCEAIASTIQTARTFLKGKPLAISTVTLKPRYNPYDKSKRVIQPDELPPQVDVRQLSLFGAAWTLGSLKYMAESGELRYITFYETTGWCGVMEKGSGSALPDKFPSTASAVFPIYHVFADVAEFVSGEVIQSRSSQPLKIESLVLYKAGKQRILLANMTNEVQLARLEQAKATYLLLSESTAEEALTEPETFRAKPGQAWTGELALPPYALVRIDS
jgi:D-apionolactonase